MSTEQVRTPTVQLSRAREAQDAAAILPLLADDVVVDPSASLGVEGRYPHVAARPEQVAEVPSATPARASSHAETIKREVLTTLVDDVSMVRIHMTSTPLRGDAHDNHYLSVSYRRDGMYRVAQLPDTLRFAQLGFMTVHGAA